MLAVIALVGGGICCGRTESGKDVAAPAALGRFNLIKGAVFVKARGLDVWKPATVELRLGQDDLVRTGPAGIAEIVLWDGARIHLDANSLIVIAETGTRSGGRRRDRILYL